MYVSPKNDFKTSLMETGCKQCATTGTAQLLLLFKQECEALDKPCQGSHKRNPIRMTR